MALELADLRFPREIAEEVKKAVEPLGVSVANEPQADKKTSPTPRSPFIMFINGKSGGHLGPDLLRVSAELLTPVQVFDLQTAKPHKVVPAVLETLDQLCQKGNESAKAVRANLKIFVAGGDGTVGWLLSVVENVLQPPPIAVIPLGTGNDLSRSFGWGKTFATATDEAIKTRLLEGAGGTASHLDSWILKVTPSEDMDRNLLAEDLPPAMQQVTASGEDGNEVSHFQGNFYNYFSIGMDAQVAYAFHHLRNTKPGIARGPRVNKVIYATFGCTQGWFCASCAPQEHVRCLDKVTAMQVQKESGGPFVDLPLDPRFRALMVLNLQSYAGGRNPWGEPATEDEKKNGWTPARPDDAKLEILGLTDGWHSLFMLGKLKGGVRLAQVYGIRFELRGEHRGSAFLQLDGEPWEQRLSRDSRQPTVLEITCKPRPALMLANKGAKVLQLGGKPAEATAVASTTTATMPAASAPAEISIAPLEPAALESTLANTPIDSTESAAVVAAAAPSETTPTIQSVSEGVQGAVREVDVAAEQTT